MGWEAVSPTKTSPTAGEMTEGVLASAGRGAINQVTSRLNADFASGIGRSVLQGMTFGFGDEIGAGLRSLGGEEYSIIRDKIRADMDEFRDEETAFAYGTEIASALLTPGGVIKVLSMAPKAAKAAASLLPSAAKGRLAQATLGGAAYGAGTAPEMEAVPAGAIAGGVIGAGGQKLGEPISRATSALGRELSSRLGISKLTPGQLAGGYLNKMEQAMTSVPFMGGGVEKARRASVEAFPAMLYNRALRPLGKSVPKDLDARQAFNRTKSIITQEYDEVLEGIDVPFGDEALDALDAVVSRAKENLGEVGKDQAKDFENLVLNRVISAAGDNNDVLSGAQLKKISSEIRKKMSDAIKKNDFDLADAYSDMDASLLSLFADQAPSMATRLKKLDRAYSNYVPLRRAAAMADESAFSPAQALSAVRAAEKKLGATGEGALAAGEGRMQPLMEISKKVLGASLPDSGTAMRSGVLGTVGGLTGIGVGTGYVSPEQAAMIAASGLAGRGLYTKPGMLLLGRPSVRLTKAAARSPATAGLLAEQAAPGAQEMLLGPIVP